MRRGISTFTATLLLVVLAVAAGVVIWAYVMGYIPGTSSEIHVKAGGSIGGYTLVSGNYTTAIFSSPDGKIVFIKIGSTWVFNEYNLKLKYVISPNYAGTEAVFERLSP